MTPVQGYAAARAGAPLTPYRFSRRPPGPHDVRIDIAYCGVCHSDVHQARDEWGRGSFPMVPGHEIAGVVAQVGSHVSRFRVGDRAGVGCMVDACRTCVSCRADRQQFCEVHCAMTYNGTEMDRLTPTQGGYAQHIVVHEDFVLRLPQLLPLERLAPLMCAGITTYAPLRACGVGAGTKVAVLGLGGLGHMAVKLAVAMGAEVTVLSSSAHKEADARALGAQRFALTTAGPGLRPLARTFDCILDTVSAPHALDPVVAALRPRGTLVLLGVPPAASELHTSQLVTAERRIVGSLIGGIAQTQEMLDFCADKDVVADVEVLPLSEVNTAFERMLRGDVKYRFVVEPAAWQI